MDAILRSRTDTGLSLDDNAPQSPRADQMARIKSGEKPVIDAEYTAVARRN